MSWAISVFYAKCVTREVLDPSLNAVAWIFSIPNNQWRDLWSDLTVIWMQLNLSLHSRLLTFLVRLYSGHAIVQKLLTYFLLHPHRPTIVRFSGILQANTLETFHGPRGIPCLVTIWPRKLTWVLTNSHVIGLSFKLACLNLSTTSLYLTVWQAAAETQNSH